MLQSNPDSKLRNAFVTIRLPDLSKQILQNVAGEGNGRGSAGIGESLRGLWSSVLSANLISFAFDRQCLSKVYTMTLHDSPPTAGNDYYSHYSSFNDAPSCLLSPHFNGREELDCIARIFATVHTNSLLSDRHGWNGKNSGCAEVRNDVIQPGPGDNIPESSACQAPPSKS